MTNNRRGASTEVKNNENLEEQTMFDDLSNDILELILKLLTLDNNIRASVVCKRWHSIATSVRVYNCSPWLMYCPKNGDQYEFYDPMKYKTYSVEFPELSDSTILYAKDGWLLLFRFDTKLFFFNPFTREMIKLPRFDQTCYLSAFSCAPTSSDCVVFIVSYVSSLVVTISTCYPGSIEWITANYQNLLPLSRISFLWNKVVFCNGLFYCLSFDGLLAKFDTTEHNWTVMPVFLPNCRNKSCARNVCNQELMFMTEQEGDIIAIGRDCSAKTIVFKLDQTSMQWKEIRTLDGRTIFVGFNFSHSRVGLPVTMRNHIYFPVFETQCHSLISFSLDDRRMYPNRSWFQCDLIDCFDDDIIWIEQPKDFSGFK